MKRRTGVTTLGCAFGLARGNSSITSRQDLSSRFSATFSITRRIVCDSPGASVNVGGDFDHALILGGYGDDNVPKNGHTQIGAITVGGDWIASSVRAGAR